MTAEHPATKIVNDLSTDQINQRLAEIEAERAALITLLKASRARDRRLSIEGMAVRRPEQLEAAAVSG